MRKIALLLSILFVCYFGQSQTILKGVITDTLSKEKLHNSTVVLLKQKDSVLYKFTRTNREGNFEFANINAGKYLLMISRPGYADYFDSVTVNVNETNTLANIFVTTKMHLLEEVIVRQKISAIRFKGDTLEYRADSFKVGPNATVQDLLRKLPGISVNNKGEITAQGQKVNKVLVDGEEFFSDDPAVVTQNLSADAVKNVQVFDKASDQAAFTGIDDGEKSRTINLQLKEDKKKGYFGKVEGGTDFDKYNKGKALVNVFKGKKKFAAYLTTDNTKYESLDWSERRNYGEDLNSRSEISDDGGMMMWSNGDDFSWGQGLPNSTTGGAHYSIKSKNEKHNSINTYQFNDLKVRGINQTTTQTLLKDGSYFINNSTQDFNNQRQRNRLRSTYEITFDSTSSLKIIATGSVIKSNSKSIYSGNSFDDKNIKLNDFNRSTLNENTDENFIANIIYRKRLKKKGRTISFSTDLNATNKIGDGYLFATNNYYTGSLSTSKLDQQKTNNEALRGANGRLSYTEPLNKYTSLELNYRFAFNTNDAERNTLEGGTNGIGKYINVVDTLSNHFIFNNNSNAGGFNIRYNKKKIRFSLGSSLGTVNYKLKELNRNENRGIKFTNFLPQASFGFTPKKQTRINLNYSGTTTNPTLQQINPIIDIADPLYITIGNQNLRQEFRHNISANFSDYKVLKEKSIYLSANLTLTDNAITNANTLDKLTGKRTSQAINVKGNYNFSMWSSYSFQVAPSFNLNFGFNPRVSKFVNVIDGKENINKSNQLAINISTSYWGEKKYNYYFDLSPSYNNSKSTINPTATKYWSLNNSANLELKLPKKWYVTFNSEINLYEKTSVFANTSNVYLLSASIKKSIDKAEKWQVSIFMNDILNQNQEINRNINSNFITETTQQNIRRYGMLVLTYNFSKNGKPSDW